jgi:signal peptidase I
MRNVKSKIKKILWLLGEYILYLFLSMLLALFIRLFLCNFYRVPSDSMTPAIVAGDFIMAEKWTYGARIFTSLKFTSQQDPPLKRVPGFGSIHRNDVVVFNYPHRDTWDTVRMNLSLFLIKRCIGIAGDSLSIVDGYYRIAGVKDTVGHIPGQKQWVRHCKWADSSILRTFPFDTAFHWNAFNFGPFYIPAAGASIPLTPHNFTLFHTQITYETDATVILKDSLVYINDSLAREYTFRENWYFMAGDNVANSQDSRYFGLVPEKFIIGRACIILSSKDMYSGKRRWRRMFKGIKN